MKRVFLLYFLSAVFYLNGITQVLQIPKGFEIIADIKGDLDKDGIDERVIVYNTRVKPTDSIYTNIDRELIIYKNKKASWQEWKRSKTAVMNSGLGGTWGDPFGQIEIKKGILEIYHEGGSSSKWNQTDMYRFQDGTFKLIGYTSFSGANCEEWESVDFNLSTGKLIYSKEFERCKGDNGPIVYKKQQETFYKKRINITLNDRHTKEVKIMTPKYKAEIYIDDGTYNIQ